MYPFASSTDGVVQLTLTDVGDVSSSKVMVGEVATAQGMRVRREVIIHYEPFKITLPVLDVELVILHSYSSPSSPRGMKSVVAVY